MKVSDRRRQELAAGELRDGEDLQQVLLDFYITPEEEDSVVAQSGVPGLEQKLERLRAARAAAAAADNNPEDSAAAPEVVSQGPLASDVAGANVADMGGGDVSAGSGRVLDLDPECCVPWEYNARMAAALDEETCRGLMVSLVDRGGQLQPGLVRPAPPESGARYEVIAGVRRWWSVRALRKRGHDGLWFRATLREGLGDQEAFALVDAENRERLDVTAVERGRSFDRGLRTLYDGNVELFGRVVGVKRRMVYNLLAVGGLPDDVIQAVGGGREISVRVGLRLVAYLKAERKKVRREVAKILEERRSRAETGEPQLTAAEALRRVQRVAQPAGSARQVLDPVRLAGGQDLLSGTYEPGKGWQLRIRVPDSPVAIEELSDALSAMIVRHWPQE